MAGYIGTQAVSVNTTSATISDDLAVGDDALITGTLTTTAEAVFNGGFTNNGTTSTFESSTADFPLVVIKNATNDAAGSRLRFTKDKGAAGADGDDIGTIEFIADNDAQQQTLFASILAEVLDASDGAEGGSLRLKVATHDGELQTGLGLFDGDAEDEIDVFLGRGTASVTTTVGALTVSVGDATLANGNLTVVSGHGINFADTGDSSVGASISELLDDYEEGVFTATITCGDGTNNGTITLTSSGNGAYYTKIGRLVTVGARLDVSSVSSPAEQLFITGLPFTALFDHKTAGLNAVTPIIFNPSSALTLNLCAEISNTHTTSILFRDNIGATGAVVAIADKIDADSILAFTATYVAA